MGAVRPNADVPAAAAMGRRASTADCRPYGRFKGATEFPRGKKEQDGRTPFAPRCLKMWSRSDCSITAAICSPASTSLYFEGAGGQTLGQHGSGRTFGRWSWRW